MLCLGGRLMPSSWRGRVMFIYNSKCRVTREPSWFMAVGRWPWNVKKAMCLMLSLCAAEELKFYRDNVDPADMTSLKKPTTEHEPVMKFKSADDKLVDFVPGDSSK